MKKVLFLLIFVIINSLTLFAQEATVSKNVVPQSFQGNWLKTDGSNEWIYGIYDSLVICDADFWKIIQVTFSDKKMTLQLEKEGKHKTLYGQLDKKGKLKIGESPKKGTLLSRNKTFKKNYIIPNDEDFSLPILKSDSSTIKGFIRDFDAKNGNTGEVIVDNVLANDQFKYPFTILPDGTYQVKFPMQYPSTIYLDFPGIRINPFLEPGKSIVLFTDSTENERFYKNSSDYASREKRTLFMGDLSVVNSDLQSVDTINHYDYNTLMQNILNMSAEEYKKNCLVYMQQDLVEFQNYRDKYPFSKKALSKFQRDLTFRTYSNILYFNWYKEDKYIEWKKEQGNQSEKSFVKEQLSSEYFSFLKDEELNNPLSLLSNGYSSVLNSMFFSDTVRAISFNYYINAFSDYIRKKSIALTDDDQKYLNKLLSCDTKEKLYSAYTEDSTATSQFNLKYLPIHTEVGKSVFAYSEAQSKNLKNYFGVNPGLVTELLLSQHLYSELNGGNQPYSKETIDQINETLKEPVIVDFLLQKSQQIADENVRILEANKTKSGSHFNETPPVEASKVFDEIIRKYKGKIIFVDFWATWCGPCKEGIKKMKPVKEEYLGKDVVFVYLTDESSPIETYNLMLPDIKGEHYRFNSEVWSDLVQRFSIKGIPRYVLIDKEGKVVDKKIDFNFEVNDFKNLIQEQTK